MQIYYQTYGYFLKGNKLFSVFLKFQIIITHCKALQKEILGSASSTSSSVLEHTDTSVSKTKRSVDFVLVENLG